MSFILRESSWVVFLHIDCKIVLKSLLRLKILELRKRRISFWRNYFHSEMIIFPKAKIYCIKVRVVNFRLKKVENFIMEELFPF